MTNKQGKNNTAFSHKENSNKRSHSSYFPLLLSILAASLFSTLSVHIASANFFDTFPKALSYAIHACAAISLVIAIRKIIQFLKQHSIKRFILHITRKNLLLSRVVDDFPYRTVLLASFSLLFNLVWAIIKIVAGLYYASAWLIILAGYYVVLVISKFMMLLYTREKNTQNDAKIALLHEWRAYRLCGILLLLLAAFLQGMVILTAKNQNMQGSFYNENIILVIALYDFYCLGSSIIYMIAKRKDNSPIINSVKSISFASSLVSILSLQMSMFSVFGSQSDVTFEHTMNIMTGSIIWLIISVLGLMMIHRGNQKLRSMEEIQ